MMTKEGSVQIVNFIMLGRGHISHLVIMYYVLLFQYTVHWLLLCYGVMMLVPNTMVDFHFFYDGAVDI